MLQRYLLKLCFPAIFAIFKKRRTLVYSSFMFVRERLVGAPSELLVTLFMVIFVITFQLYYQLLRVCYQYILKS